ncbi:MAG: CRISPR-associated endonuclease Cas1 [Nautiliaceae bacterium]
MRDLFVLREVKISRDGKSLKIEDNPIKKIPVSLIRNVYFFGNVELNNSARNLLLEKNKPIYLFSSKAEFRGVIHNAKLKSNYKNRLLQYKHIENLEIAKFIVNRKIETIESYTNRSLRRYKEKLKEAKSLNEVLGVEGSCSLYLFEKIREELKSVGIEFKKREFHPPKDRVNSLLSFAYSLYYGFLHTVILEDGFDPYLAFLHRKRGKHMAFVSDVMEGYRVYLSAFVVKVLKSGKIGDEDFKEGDVYLSYEGKRKFVKLYLEFVKVLDNYSFLEEIKSKLSEM